MIKTTGATIDQAEQVLLSWQVREREERKRLAIYRLGARLWADQGDDSREDELVDRG